MRTVVYGAGRAPAGASKMGFGSPATSDAPGVAAIGEARSIDPYTRDYVFDAATGHVERMSSVAQAVYLAMVTVRGQSAVAGFGIAAMPDRIGAKFDEGVRVAVNAALSHLINAGEIEIISVEAGPSAHATRSAYRVTWRDIRTQEELSTDV